MTNEVRVVPFASVAVHCTVFAPTPSVAGEVGAHETELEGPVKRTVAVGSPGAVVVVTSARGPSSTGGAVFLTQWRGASISFWRLTRFVPSAIAFLVCAFTCFANALS